MKIGILSDTHNDEQTTQKILSHFRNLKITTLIHCGDLTGPSLIRKFEDFQVFLSYGNGDYLTGQIAEELVHLGTNSQSANVISTTIESIPIAVVHGHDLQQLEILQKSNRYTIIFTGHTHESMDRSVNGTRTVNPGAAHSRGYHRATYAVFDPETRLINSLRL